MKKNRNISDRLPQCRRELSQVHLNVSLEGKQKHFPSDYVKSVSGITQ